MQMTNDTLLIYIRLIYLTYFNTINFPQAVQSMSEKENHVRV